jgi:hypothetical protein
VLAGHGQHGRQEYGSMDSSILTLTKQRATLFVLIRWLPTFPSPEMCMSLSLSPPQVGSRIIFVCSQEKTQILLPV